MADAILRRPAVEKRVGLARSTLYSLMSKGHFPRPIKLSERAVGWRTCDIDAWLQDRFEQSAQVSTQANSKPSVSG